MATLEKIRSKSVFLIVVIGVALLAFIIGDALTNSRNILGDQTTIAKVGSTKIDYTDYQRKREDLNNRLEQQRRQNPNQNIDNQILPQMALEELLVEQMLSNAAKKAGIESSGNALRFYMLEMPNNPEVQKIIQQLNQINPAIQTPQQAYEVIFNPKRNNMTEAQAEPFQRAWIAAEKETAEQIRKMTYQRLLVGTVRANDLDKKALYQDYVSTRNVDLAFKPYGEIDEKKYPVSDQEINDLYNQRKGKYMVMEPTREISFIAVNIMPSDADKKASAELAQKTLAELNTKSGQLSKELKKEGVGVTRHTQREKDVPSRYRQIVSTLGIDSARIVSNDLQGFTVVRVISRRQEIDSLQLNIVMAATDNLGKQVQAALNSGLALDSVTARFNADSVATQADQWVPLYTADGQTNALTKEILDSLRNSGGKYVPIMSGNGMTLAKVVKETAPVTICEYDEATYALAPSQATKSEERTKFEKFLGANNTAAKFNENAAKAGYNVQKFTITSSTPAIPRFQGMNQYYPESRQVVRWVMMDSETGEVSHIYNASDAMHPAMYAAAIDDSYEEYVPVTNENVRKDLTDRIRARKAGEAMVKTYSPKTQSLQSAAQAMGVDVRNLPNFRFGSRNGINDLEVAGKIAGSKADKKVVIVSGEDGVYVYQIMGANTENFPMNDQQYEQQFMQLTNPQLLEMLQGKNRLKNNLYKFEAGD